MKNASLNSLMDSVNEHARFLFYREKAQLLEAASQLCLLHAQVIGANNLPHAKGRGAQDITCHWELGSLPFDRW